MDRAIITHAHSDHAQWGCRAYLCSPTSGPLLRHRLRADSRIELLPWGARCRVGGAVVSLHPAGHILGSAQVRIETPEGGVTVVSGDYKVHADPTCEPFEPVRCHTFISECTFGLPIYRWPTTESLREAITAWWVRAQASGRVAMLYAYALGKAQRVLSLLDPTIGPIGVHGAVAPFLPIYRRAGIHLPAVVPVGATSIGDLKRGGLIIAPGSVQNSPWERKFGPVSRASGSGWMTVRGNRRRAALDDGFPLSDHADWPGLLAAIAATRAETVALTHGDTSALARYLRETTPLNVIELAHRFNRPLEATE